MDNSINSMNFKGAFLINTGKMSSALKNGLEKRVSNYKKVIYENVDNKGRNLYVLNNKFDYDFAKFIKLNSIGFKYFPEINTSFFSNIHNAAEVINTIASDNLTTISGTPKLMKFIETNRFACRSRHDLHTDKTDLILDKLRIRTGAKPKKRKGGVIKIEDKDSGKIINISPKDNYGITYVYTDIRGEGSSRYAMNDKCEILCTYNTPDGIIKFSERFNSAIKDNKKL